MSRASKNGNELSTICIGGIPQGSCIGQLALIIYINGLPNDEDSETDFTLFMDDTTLSEIMDMLATMFQGTQLAMHQIALRNL